jgi:hypothetical protein
MGPRDDDRRAPGGDPGHVSDERSSRPRSPWRR